MLYIQQNALLVEMKKILCSSHSYELLVPWEISLDFEYAIYPYKCCNIFESKIFPQKPEGKTKIKSENIHNSIWLTSDLWFPPPPVKQF